jgi:hypothetical protein
VGLRREAASDVAEISLHFFPYHRTPDDRVQISFGLRRVTVTDPELKADPRPQANLLLPAVATTGQVIPVCEVRRHHVRVGVFAIADRDTERRRLGRWGVKPQLANALPADLAPLVSGRQSGVV